MTDDRTVITVRGQAHRTVDPDLCILFCQLEARRPTHAEALEAAARARARATTALADAGAVARAANTDREPLTWSAGAVHTFRAHGKANNPRGERNVANIEFQIRVRDFALLDQVGAVVTETDDLDVGYVTWSLDPDHPAEREVRGDAVRAALRRAGDYAAALGARVVAVEQIADVGLLAESSGPAGAEVAHPLAAGPGGGFRARGFSSAKEDPVELDLDPQPKHIHATVEIRLQATGADPTGAKGADS